MSRRIEKVNELIKREIGEFFIKEIEFPRDTFVTISKVDTTVDLKFTKIWISVLPQNKKNKILKILKKHIYLLQGFLNKKLVMQYVPKISFAIDETGEKVERINRLIDEVGKNR